MHGSRPQPHDRIIQAGYLNCIPELNTNWSKISRSSLVRVVRSCVKGLRRVAGEWHSESKVIWSGQAPVYLRVWTSTLTRTRKGLIGRKSQGECRYDRLRGLPRESDIIEDVLISGKFLDHDLQTQQQLSSREDLGRCDLGRAIAPLSTLSVDLQNHWGGKTIYEFPARIGERQLSPCILRCRPLRGDSASSVKSA